MYGPARHGLLLAAIFWTAAGSGLFVVGLVWAVGWGTLQTAWLAPLFLALGIAKAEWVLRRVTVRICTRVVERGEMQWLPGFMSLKLWLAIGAMILTGTLLRRYVLSLDVAGLIYVAVGLALLLAARHLWRRWWSAGINP